jgi:acyl-CoA oxidase
MAPNPQWVKDLKPAGPQGHELLAKERDSSNINIQKLSEFLHTKKELDRKYRILKVLESEKVFDKSQNYFAGRIDRFETSLARAKRLRQLTVKLGWDKDDFNTANELLSESTPYRLHDSMFLVSLAISLC